MLRHLLRFAAPVMAGQALRIQIKRYTMRAGIVLLALFFFAVALIFLIMSLYSWLLTLAFTEFEAALIIAAGSFSGSALILICMSFEKYWRTRGVTHQSQLLDIQEIAPQLAQLDRQAAKLVDKVGPVKLLALAFSIGMAASRGAGRKN